MIKTKKDKPSRTVTKSNKQYFSIAFKRLDKGTYPSELGEGKGERLKRNINHMKKNKKA